MYRKCTPVSYSSVVKKGHAIPDPAPLNKNAPTPPALPAHLGAPVPREPIRVEYKKITPKISGFTPKTEFHRNKMMSEIESFNDDSHRWRMEKAVMDFKKSMAHLFPEAKVWLCGSFAAGIDLFDSDIDFSIKVEFSNAPDLTAYKKLKIIGSWMKNIEQRELKTTEKEREFNRALGHVRVFEQVKTIGARVPVLALVHRETKVSIDVTVDSEASIRNTQLLVWYGQMDKRFPLLCRVLKRWAKFSRVEGASKGRLNCFSLCLLLIHYLQLKGVLPNLQAICEEINGRMVVESDDYNKRNLQKELNWKSSNETDVVELYGSFLLYCGRFDFHHRWISVRRGKALKKTRNAYGESTGGMPNNSWLIVVEDPFISEPWNCAGSVFCNADFKRIRIEFKLAYDRMVTEQKIFVMNQPSEWRMRLSSEEMHRDMSHEQWREDATKQYRPYPRHPCNWFWDPFGTRTQRKYWEVSGILDIRGMWEVTERTYIPG